jgi:glycosyltransferase involved in cell wall biosynthesis
MSNISQPLSFMVVGSENPRIRDFFGQVGHYGKISYLDMEPLNRRTSIDQMAACWRWRRPSEGVEEARTCVPRRWGGVSSSLVHWFCRRRFADAGRPDAVVFTWPYLASLCEKLPDLYRIYYCKDPFDRWPGATSATREMEQRLLNNCDLVFTVSRQLAEDFAPRSRGKVIYLPNAVDDSFLSLPSLPRPDDLPTGQPIVGCIGQINYTYDLEYMQQMAALSPGVTFCFVGAVVEYDGAQRRRILSWLRRTENVIWLGERPHEQLPAYIQHFDICLNCLRVDDNNNRRSPLRLYDYLVSDRPVITTGVREAYEHVPHVVVAESPEEAANVIRETLEGKRPIDAARRRAYIEQHTWSVRARQFLGYLRKSGLIAA